MTEYGTDPFLLVRRYDPDTSHEAAYSVDTTKLERMVYEAIKSYGINGCISDNVRDMYPRYPYSSITARYRALLDKGMIIDSGTRKPGKSGRNQRVLIATCWVPQENLDAVREQTTPIQERVPTAESSRGTL
jgi:hypothetical protein